MQKEYCRDPLEIVEFAQKPCPFAFIKSDPLLFGQHELVVEDLSASQMKEFLAYRERAKKYKAYLDKRADENGVLKEYHKMVLQVDQKRLALKISVFRKIPHELIDGGEGSREYWLLFDMKKGKVKFSPNFDEIENGFADWDEIEFVNKRKKALRGLRALLSKLDIRLFFKRRGITYIRSLHQHFLLRLATFEGIIFDKAILETAYQKLVELARAYTGCALESLDGHRPKNFLRAMYSIALLPFEPNLWYLINSAQLDYYKIRFRPSRRDSKVFARFCKKLKIVNCPSLRRYYLERPYILFTCKRLKDAGFKDWNLYNRVLSGKQNCAAIDRYFCEDLSFFCNVCIKERGELATMNALLRLQADSDQMDLARDAMRMFRQYYAFLSPELKRAVLRDGLTEYNHNALSKVALVADKKLYVFSYSEEQKVLEDEIDGYKFFLPKSSEELLDIASALHNCVASYADSVKDKKCLIVCAQKAGQYKLCIEVRGKNVCQERANYNNDPSPEEAEILLKWHSRHGLNA